MTKKNIHILQYWHAIPQNMLKTAANGFALDPFHYMQKVMIFHWNLYLTPYQNLTFYQLKIMILG